MKVNICRGRRRGALWIEDADDGPMVGFAALDIVKLGAACIEDLEVFGEETWFGGDGEGARLLLLRHFLGRAMVFSEIVALLRRGIELRLKERSLLGYLVMHRAKRAERHGSKHTDLVLRRKEKKKKKSARINLGDG